MSNGRKGVVDGHYQWLNCALSMIILPVSGRAFVSPGTAVLIV
jgi:hypothetical protein